ncbi:hypothetical protein [Streptomyces sp. NPDC021224]|uniref:hypothetical protein n=1 Tax=unclassified Streptomyces TaxID=2593676 RepID=UPI0037BAA92F
MSGAGSGSPLPGERAFGAASGAALWSQAAQLVMLGAQLTGDTDVLDGDEARLLEVPRIRPLRAPFDRTDADRLLRRNAQSLGAPALEYAGDGALAAVASASVAGTAELRRRLWLTVRRAGSTAVASEAAAALLYVAAESREEVLRVPAAAEATRLGGGRPDRRLVDALAEGRGGDPLLRAIALDALVRTSGPPPDGSAGRPPDAPGGFGPRRGGTSLVVHGTWSRMAGSWWRPGGELFDYLDRTVVPNLYADPDYFRWEGLNSPASRSLGAEDLIRWSALHGSPDLDVVFAHSHGGNVVLDAAARGGIRARLAVLMSVPARPPDPGVWSAVLRQVNRLVGVRVHCDLVVIAARGRQRFGPPVRDITLPGVWFDHHATVRPEVWAEHGLAAEIRAERGQAGTPGF